ncbi:hypothetical protein Acr_14g0006900 [Actinidia rufa]|uniref:Homologous recombination OB-fold protein OB-fold domain-containing protein n=1 Tax=Actinidia rufa TaxID=165716 RepID=A0A7J0FQR0_9ERIC|nr:hypothetical protein Acr_14g0006900 [Actinidia rufa]
MEAWEALDLDDSDLPSLLRPCKRRRRRHRHHSNSQHSHQFFNSSLSLQQQPTSPSQTLPSPQSLQLPSPNSTTPPLIPGPAGPVQAAMLRKVRAHQNPTCATQEYIRRAVEDGEEDEDFNRNPWLCALQFLGMVGGGLPITPLSSIVLCTYIGRVDRIVAVIKSSVPNGLGDLMVTLKDPTGTIDASIHHKVLAEVEFRKEISVGSVLILQKVAVFAPIRSTRYLNITLSNVVKENGVAEHKVHHLLEVTCAISFYMHVPKSYWSDAIFTDSYLANRMPSTIFGGELLVPLSSAQPIYSSAPLVASSALVDPYSRPIALCKGGEGSSLRFFIALSSFGEPGSESLAMQFSDLVCVALLEIGGEVNYITITHPDIAFAMSVVSQFMSAPRSTYMEVALRIVKYLKAHPCRGLFYGVISKDTGPQLQQNYLVYAIKPVVLGSECNKETGNMHEDLSFGVDEIEGSMISGNSNVGGTSHSGKQMEMGKPLPQSEHCRDQNCGIVGKEPLLVGKDAAANEILNKVVRIIDDTMDSEQRGVDDVNKLRMGSYSSSPNKPEADLVESQNDQVKVTKGANGVVKQRHTPPIPRASIPEWTDEQLNQLFVADCEDGGSLF